MSPPDGTGRRCASASLRRTALLLVVGCALVAGCRSATERPRTLDEGDRPHPTLPGSPGIASDTPLTRIAFGSCNREDRPQPLWEQILAVEPQLWIWTGDNIYGDTEDMEVLAAKYAMQQRQPDYERFVGRVPIVGTWDDHDYGSNDGGSDYSRRADSQRLALDFLGEPPDGPRRGREGLYAAYGYGPPGRRVKVILLDTRYFRDPLPPRGETSTGDILGEAQWRWLERQLRGSSAQVHLIVSSIQVIPEDHRYEKWANFPRARERLLALIGESRAPGVVLVSGDRHIAELSRLDDPRIGYPLYEVTSSGLTHSYAAIGNERNRHRVGPLVPDLNYGTVDVDWDAPSPRVTLRVRDARGTVRIEQTVAAGAPGR